MKKSIAILGLAFVAFVGQSFTSEVPTMVKTEMGYAVNTPLCNAITKGDVEAVKKFLEYGADANEQFNGKTPLMYAARYNRVEIIKILLEKGANKNIEDERGLTAYQYAESSKATEAMALLK
ncbi:ankyrin repeat domain-containing protein [Flavobacterium amniphilum]|uniref:ankyrin repeat domain-containing protein n=1 Tax=Flavobacterium amniphilum TaxID=1834035 RepID=UPI00202A20DA|nr:ankyrin repeat domain-containing protein [Flavobacterium amniphilum]MCL9807308.1 ankyrin repeat domain-containing protein [Flavobacterium amniphilum]